MNNPVNMSDPTGFFAIYKDDNGNDVNLYRVGTGACFKFIVEYATEVLRDPKGEVKQYKSGISSGFKAVVESYTVESIGERSASFGTGAAKGYLSSKSAQMKIIKNATGRVAKRKARDAMTGVVARGALRGGLKALGWMTAISTLYTFGNGFMKGYKQEGQRQIEEQETPSLFVE